MASSTLSRYRAPAILVGTIAAGLLIAHAGSGAQDGTLPIIRRTEFGVPHILATDFRGIGMGLGYTQVEDYGDRVILSLMHAKGIMGRTFGRDSMQSDFGARREQMRVDETYHLLDADTRAVDEGFAEGVNIYIRTHPERVPAWAKPIFIGHDVAALDIASGNTTTAQRLVMRQLQRDSAAARGGVPAVAPTAGPGAEADSAPNADDGSNAWALAPSRTKSGRAILLRNPHLAWDAGYWEAHITIPGKINFYGDFRIGGPFIVIAGFNEQLGWATTNNAHDMDEVYRLDADTLVADHYLFDGASVPIRSQDITVDFVNPDGTMGQETRPFLSTPLGPVVYRTRQYVWVLRATTEGDYRAGEEFLRMMRAQSLAEWKDALAMRARATSNLTYADKAGNIFLIWMTSAPRLPHPPGGDSVAIPAHTSADIWTTLIRLDSLPQVLNPKGGYIQNENDPPHYSNLHALLDTLNYPANFEHGELRLRSQHAIQLLDNNKKFSLEDVVKLKHSMKMLLADRVKDDLLKAVRSAPRDSALTSAAALLAKWDNTASAESRGSLLFETWWRRYSGQARDSAYAEPWSRAKLNTTPRGLGRPDLAVDALAWSVADMKQRYGTIDIPWGDVYRVRRGNVDVPVGGCSGTLGCFRVLTYANAPDGKRIANSGDGWVLAVEFGKQTPRAYSILAYGENQDSTSQNYSDQAAMFARGEFKPVRYTEPDIKKGTVREYRPGER